MRRSRFAHALLRPQDQMSLLQFATDVRELTPFTNKLSQIDRGLGQLRGDWATALYDAIYLGSATAGRESKGARCWCWSPTATIPPAAPPTPRPLSRLCATR